MLMALDSNVWGPHYWFFLHTIALTYPHNPNEVVKKNIMILYKIFIYLFQLKKLEMNLQNY